MGGEEGAVVNQNGNRHFISTECQKIVMHPGSFKKALIIIKICLRIKLKDRYVYQAWSNSRPIIIFVNLKKKKKNLKNKSGQIKVELSTLKPRNEEAMVKEHDEHWIHLQIKMNVK